MKQTERWYGFCRALLYFQRSLQPNEGFSVRENLFTRAFQEHSLTVSHVLPMTAILQLRSWRHKGFSKRESSVIIYRKHCSVFETSGGEKSKGVDLLQAGLLYSFFTLYILLKYITNETFWLPAEQKWTSSFSRYIRSILVMQLIFDWLF